MINNLRHVNTHAPGSFYNSTAEAMAVVTDFDDNPDPALPKKQPEIEPEKLPAEDPGLQPDTKPKKEDDDDEDDDDDDDGEIPYIEPEIGDDPDRENSKMPVM